jgi:hypothetical protein
MRCCIAPASPDSAPAPLTAAASYAVHPFWSWHHLAGRRACLGRIFGGAATRRMPWLVNIAMNCTVRLELTA